MEAQKSEEFEGLILVGSDQEKYLSLFRNHG